MPRNRRYIESNKPYSIAFRVREGLPFVATLYMKLLLGGIMARAQRDFKVILSHYLWMANHVHILVIAKDPAMFTAFYGEIQKKITDTMKALLGFESLTLWQGIPIVAQILDVDAVIEQIAYFYANPSRANLVNSIEEYPGLSSYADFRNIAPSVAATVEKIERWVPATVLPRLPSRSMKHHKDLDFTEELTALGIPHKLTISPNAWMNCFEITEEAEIAEINERILSRIRGKEDENAQRRAVDKKSVLGEKALRIQEILRPHKPAPFERRIYVISSDSELRIGFIRHFNAICDRCRECFINSLRGLFCEWPPGVFRPSFLHVASAWGA